MCASLFSITTPGRAARLIVPPAQHHCAAHYCIFYSKHTPPTPPAPHPQHLPTAPSYTNTHCTPACWVMLTGCAGCLCENFVISLRWGDCVLGQWARAGFLFTQVILRIHISCSGPKSDPFLRHKLLLTLKHLALLQKHTHCIARWKNGGLVSCVYIYVCINDFHLAPFNSLKEMFF